jgi:small subunit ribosomal protein S20
MANSVSAKKRIRQNETHRARNKWRKVSMRDAIKAFDEKILHGSNDEASQAFRLASKLLDKTAQQGALHKNTAARKKSRMSVRLKAKSAK